MSDLNALVIFARVVEAGSFSAAARRMKVPLSTVSRRVADLEDDLGIRLLERSTRRLRLTETGADILEHARRTAELSDSVDAVVSYKRANVAGTLRLSAPPSLSDSLIAPLVCSFQNAYPNVSVQILITERSVDQITEGVDLVFRFGALKDSSAVARTVLSYRHLLLASPAYLAKVAAIEGPQDLLKHRLLAFSRWRPESRWHLVNVSSKRRETLHFAPYLSMNDYAGLAVALVNGSGIGDLPPMVRPEFLRDGRLVEVLPAWRFPSYDLSLLHLGSRHIAKPVKAFKDFAVQTLLAMFPKLPG